MWWRASSWLMKMAAARLMIWSSKGLSPLMSRALASELFIFSFISSPTPTSEKSATFEQFDQVRSGKTDAHELGQALLSLRFRVSPVVLDLLVSKFDKTGGHNKAIEYDSFVECCLTVKGLTEKFKEKDAILCDSATFSYEDFMLTVLPFLVA